MGVQGKGTDRATVRQAEKLLSEGVAKAEVARLLHVSRTKVRKIAADAEKDDRK